MDIDQYEKIPLSFYISDDVVQVAKDLLGKYLFSKIGGKLTGGRIVETEAYNGRNDKACHAYHKRTPRTEIMYEKGGVAYVYLCYGVHHLFNIVTNREGLADAVLIRGVEPIIGIETMMLRRKKEAIKKLTAGPGSLGQALGINKEMSGTDLSGDIIWVASQIQKEEGFKIETDVRVGVDYAEEDALLPWRFYISGNNFVSKVKNKTLT